MLSREQRLAKADEALARAYAKTEHWAGPCHECKYWRSLHHPFGSGVTEYDHCLHPIGLAAAFDHVRGAGHHEVDCRDMRAQQGLCGPEGELFEPRSQPLGWWDRLWLWMFA